MLNIIDVFSSLRTKIFLVISVISVSLYFVIPAMFPGLYPNNKKLGLGLDLVGGSYVKMNVDTDSYISSRLRGFIPEVKSLSALSSYKSIIVRDKKILVNFLDKSKCSNVLSQVKSPDRGMYARCENGNMVLAYSADMEREISKNVVSESIMNIKHRLDSYGTKEISVQSMGSSSIVVQVPGVYDLVSVKSLMGTTAKLSFHLIADPAKVSATDIMTAKDDYGNSYNLLLNQEFGGESLVSVFPGRNKIGKFIVNFKLNSSGASKFAEVTKKNVGSILAIVLDEKVIAAPVINEAIMGGSGEISGRDFDLKKVKELSLMLSFGSLPASVNISSEKSIDAVLGAESIKSGKYALIISMLLVSFTMIYVYGLFGVFAVCALGFNVLFIFAALIIGGTTVTLSGFAGIALTFGMAVDANILIFERIREFLDVHKGKKLFGVIKNGFVGAMSTILDSNITTLIAAAVMSVLGSGSVRGFALTLSIGILSSMFSAIFMTKLMIDIWLKLSSKGGKIV